MTYNLRLMDLLEPAIILVVVTGVAWFCFSGRYEFHVRITPGSMKLTTGKLTLDSLSQLREICAEWQLKRGWIGGVRRGKRLRLMFSRNVPPGCRQQMRNLWENR
jgi:Protein of unknown function (DUF3634)